MCDGNMSANKDAKLEQEAAALAHHFTGVACLQATTQHVFSKFDAEMQGNCNK